jgi:hypothetical protein
MISYSEATELTAVRQVDHTSRRLAYYVGPYCTSKFWLPARHAETALGMSSISLHSYVPLAVPGRTTFVKRDDIMSSMAHLVEFDTKSQKQFHPRK